MNKPDLERARRYVFARLAAELPADLPYHGIHHTRDDVLPAAEKLAALSKLGAEELLLVQTAALYHDLGYVERYIHNEPLGAQLAAETLPCFGYSPTQIKVIEGMILATQLPQNPNTFLEGLICDADLDSLGRDDFLETSHNLREELLLHGVELPLKSWYRQQGDFLRTHKYFTPAARALRRGQKLENIALLEKLWSEQAP
ncbi:MAG TPA: phosphohydrolase [Thermoflexia bacterium]|nr:phosphohydrolase [Thermoflexia bacterium]